MGGSSPLVKTYCDYGHVTEIQVETNEDSNPAIASLDPRGSSFHEKQWGQRPVLSPNRAVAALGSADGPVSCRNLPVLEMKTTHAVDYETDPSGPTLNRRSVSEQVATMETI